MNVVFDPTWTSRRLAHVGRDISFAWLTRNRFPLPSRLFLSRDSAGGLLERSWLGVQSYEKGRSKIAVAVEDCELRCRLNTPTGTLIHAPASFEDYTALGVLCHEVGHLVDYSLNPLTYSMRKLNGFQSLVDEEVEISRAEHNVRESFAESIRLFITNPDLLLRGRPRRWDHLVYDLKLKPLHDTRWQTVLQKTPRYVHQAVERWLRIE